jgi:diadenosine tetraphosphate (Ap4A) HIT family hydrolase
MNLGYSPSVSRPRVTGQNGFNFDACESGTVVANGAGAGQEVPHLHFHAIPRSKGANFGFKFPPNYRESMADRVELDEISKNPGDHEAQNKAKIELIPDGTGEIP